MSLVISKTFTWFDPIQLSPALWLDAADSATVDVSGGKVSQWNDKSGNNRHLTQSTDSNRPNYTIGGLNSRNVIAFNHLNSNWMGSNVSVFSSQLSFSYYIVLNRTLDSSLLMFAFQERIDNGDRQVGLQDIRSSTPIYYYNGGTSSAVILNQDSISLPINTPQVIGSVQSPTSGIVYRNFSQVATNSSTKANLTFRRFVLGGAVDSGTGTNASQQFFTGYIAEFIAIQSTLSLINRQKLEGYLAHKWGLTANLPSDHPFKINKPAP